MDMRERKSNYLESITIDDIPQNFTNSNYFMSIDTEGFDSEIIRSINCSRIFKASVIVFDIIKNGEDRLLFDSVLINDGYKLDRKTINNNIYCISTR
jgi:hypothetical protein